MFKKLLIGAWFCGAVFLVSCKGDDGAVGPAGAKGDTGAAGPTGATGATGAAGANGTGSGGGSIIAFMGSLTTDTSGNAIVGDTAFFKDFTAAEIASVEKGAFQVYIKDDGAYFPLPGFVLFADQAISYGFYYVVDGLGLYFPIFRTSAATVKKRTFEEIRVVVIPASNLRLNLNLKNYDEVVAALGLTEKDVKKITRK